MLIRGAHAYTPGKDLGVVDVVVEEGGENSSNRRIVELSNQTSQTSQTSQTLDATGLTLLPGFVDIHSHGRGGADFCDATDEAFDTIGRGKLADGVTSFLATGLTRPEENLAELCRCVERYKNSSNRRIKPLMGQPALAFISKGRSSMRRWRGRRIRPI